MKNRLLLLKNLIYVILFWVVLHPIDSNAQYDFSVSQCVSIEEAVAIVDTVLLGNVDSIFKKNITVTGDPKAIGYYNFGYIFGFNEPSGIILSSGFSGDLDESNTCSSQNANGNNSGGSDSDLMVMAGMPIYDACIIEFDMMLFNDSVFLSYIFGSEEYHDYVNTSFNDVFGFFLSGPGIEGDYSNYAINIAVVPGTSSDVSVNTINCGNQTSFCYPPPGNGNNCEFLYDNTNTGQTSFNECALDAYTVPLITGQEIQSYEWYHFKLAIGDAGDAMYDSGVLLEKGSIISIPIPEINISEGETESDVLEYIDNILLSNVLDANKANISYSGDPKAVGYFSSTEFLSMDQDNGLLVSTGHAGDANQPNVCNSNANASTNNNGINTDTDLELISGGINVNNVSIIEFDYRPSNDTINFNYVFASEEYHAIFDDASFDVFGIFLSGPEINGEFSNEAVNIATITDEALPVNSNTINFGLGGLTCSGKPEGCNNCEFLIDNSQKTDTAFFAFAYDSYTVPMNASYIVEAGEWYHIKIAIADVLTEFVDSGIFFAEGTLVSDSLMTTTNDHSFNEYIQVKPNPANDFIKVQNTGKEPILEYAIYDINGRLLKIRPFGDGSISLADMPKGILILEINSGKNKARFKLKHE